MEKKTGVAETWSCSNFPEDLFPEILSFVTVKSLVRFRCVSKSWRSMINDPDFVRLHLIRFNNQPRYESRLLFTKKSRNRNESDECFEISFVGITNSVGLPHSLGRPARTLERFQICCSADGLFTLKSIYTTDLMLWNPSIRKALILPSCPIPEINCATPWTSHRYDLRIGLGIGFDPLIKDYKYVTLSVSEESVSFIAVYTLGIKSWKTITNSLPEDRKSFVRTRAVSFRGGLCYLTRKDYYSSLKLVTFDLSTEMMVASTDGLSEINDFVKCFGYQELIVIDSGCTLALFNFTDSTSRGSIWVLESLGADIKSSIWTQRYGSTILISEVGLADIKSSIWTQHYEEDGGGRDDFEFLSLEENGEMLLRLPRMVTSYNLETHEEKVLLYKELNDGHPYIESLILL